MAKSKKSKMAARGNQTDTGTAEVIQSSKLRPVYEYFNILFHPSAFAGLQIPHGKIVITARTTGDRRHAYLNFRRGLRKATWHHHQHRRRNWWPPCKMASQRSVQGGKLSRESVHSAAFVIVTAVVLVYLAVFSLSSGALQQSTSWADRRCNRI